MIKKFENFSPDDPLGVKKCAILYSNENDAVDTFKILERYNYKIYSGNLNANGKINIDKIKMLSKEWECIIYSDNNDSFSFALKAHYTFQYLDHITVRELLKRSMNIDKYKKIKNTDLDPYDEENWGWEIDESNEEKIKLKDLRNVIIRIHSRLNYDILMKKMRELGIRWSGGELCGEEDPYFDNYPDFCIRINEKGEVNYCGFNEYVSMGALKNNKFINDYDIIGNIKRIENPDVDPYGEDDWGWEKKFEKYNINESNKHPNIHFTLKRLYTVSLIDEDVDFIGFMDHLKKLFFEDKKFYLWMSNKELIIDDEEYPTFSIITRTDTLPHQKSLIGFDMMPFGFDFVMRFNDGKKVVINSEKFGDYSISNYERKFMLDVDPYGEEEWEDTYESVKDEFLSGEKSLDMMNKIPIDYYLFHTSGGNKKKIKL